MALTLSTYSHNVSTPFSESKQVPALQRDCDSEAEKLCSTSGSDQKAAASLVEEEEERRAAATDLLAVRRFGEHVVGSWL